MSTKPIRERTARGTLRRVWVEDQLVVKEFRRLRWPGDLRRPWEREHRALIRLQQHGVPAPSPIRCERLRGGVARLQRTFVPGELLQALTPQRIAPLAEHVAAIHAAGVTINDAACDNAIVLQDGRLMFIDYGRSRVFRFRSPLFHFYVGKELARIYRQMLVGIDGAWPAFRIRYRQCVDYPAWAWQLVDAAEAYWIRRWQEPINEAIANAKRAPLIPDPQ